MHVSYSARFLKGWKATIAVFWQDSQPYGGSQWSSCRTWKSSTRLAWSTFCRHWSMNMSSPQRQGPEQSAAKCAAQRCMPRLQAETALREKTSSGPCKPYLQLFRYTPAGSASARRPRRSRRREGRKTASGSVFTVQSWCAYLCSLMSFLHTARKMGVFRAVLNSPPFLHLRSLSTTFVQRPGATSMALLLYRAYSSHAKRLTLLWCWAASSACS
mmetsp:Transcript_107373/g.313957  ORF Transcript_107373/g.313957 Transcript_107373/m.313957 type:complete len:215 (+) Transcript_107373:101-745(+)